jgi:citrate lyase subunit beta/citryl-CoA lyase
MELLIRVNSGDPMMLDLLAAARPGVVAVMVPKVESPAMLAQAIQRLEGAERTNGLAPGAIGLVALIEGPHAVLEARSIAAIGGRLIGLGFGAEDFAAAMGVRPTPLALTQPAQMVAMAARGAGLQAIGLPGGIAAIDDLTEFRSLAATARAIGMTGSVCIHPAQVPILNAAFSPSPEELDWADAVIEGFEKALADGVAAIAVRGRMVDRPVYDQALALRASARRA